MAAGTDRIPDGYVASFEYIHPKELLEELKSLTESRKMGPPVPSTIWAVHNELPPSDLYCYLGARFGKPNGIQNFFRNDSTDNLIHWEWHLKTSNGYIKFAGMNFRTDVWIHGADLPESEIQSLAKQIKADYANYREPMKHLRDEHLEEWIEFVNPYQRLRRAINRQIEELDGLKLNPKADSLPSLLTSDDYEAASKQWHDRAKDYEKAVGISFGIRAMVPVMAESFVNLMLFLLMHPSVKKDKQLRDGLFRQPMNVRVRSLPYYCFGFKGPVDPDNAAMSAYSKLVTTRNDLLHGNVNIDRLKFNELYFYGNVPVFKKYTTMWERSLGVAHRAVGLEEVHSEIAVVDAFVEYLLSLLKENIAAEMKLISEKFDLGITKADGRIGVLFGDRLVDFGFPKDAVDVESKTLNMRMVIDGGPPPANTQPPAGPATGEENQSGQNTGA
jgi:hypothetical protein